MAALVKGGAVVERIGPEALAQMKQKVKPVETAWIEKAKNKGLANPEAVPAALQEEIAASAAR